MVYSVTYSFRVASLSLVIDAVLELLGLLADVHCVLLTGSSVPSLYLRCFLKFWLLLLALCAAL